MDAAHAIHKEDTMWDRIFLQPGLGFWMGDKASRQELDEVENRLG